MLPTLSLRRRPVPQPDEEQGSSTPTKTDPESKRSSAAVDGDTSHKVSSQNPTRSYLQPDANPTQNNVPPVSDTERLPWDMPSLDETFEELSKFTTMEDKSAAWSKTAAQVTRYSDKIIDDWNKEVDYFLVYAGILSGIITAFDVQAFNLLQNATTNSQGAPPIIVALNVLWFSSLIFGFAAAAFGLTVKQWLHDYREGRTGTARQVARLRWYRYMNMQKWHVSSIISILFLLLQAAIVLFFCGLLLLLWTVHRPLAIIATLLVGVVLGLFAITTILPAVFIDCCYISPSTYVLFPLFQHIKCKILLPASRVFTGNTSHGPVREKTTEDVRCSEMIVTRTESETASISRSSCFLDSEVVAATVLGYTADEVEGLPLDKDAIPHLMIDLHEDTVRRCFNRVHAINRGFSSFTTSAVPLDFWIISLLKLLPLLWRVPTVLDGPALEKQLRGVDDEMNTALSYIHAAFPIKGCPERDRRLLLALSLVVYQSNNKARVTSLHLLHSMLCGPEDVCSTYDWDIVRFAAVAMEQRMQELHGLHVNEHHWREIILAADGLIHCCVKPVAQWEEARQDDDKEASRLCAERALLMLTDNLEHRLPTPSDDTKLSPHLPVMAFVGEGLASIIETLSLSTTGCDLWTASGMSRGVDHWLQLGKRLESSTSEGFSITVTKVKKAASRINDITYQAQVTKDGMDFLPFVAENEHVPHPLAGVPDN